MSQSLAARFKWEFFPHTCVEFYSDDVPKGKKNHNYDIKIAFEQKFVQIGVLHLVITATKFAFNSSSIHFAHHTEGYSVNHIAVLLINAVYGK